MKKLYFLGLIIILASIFFVTNSFVLSGAVIADIPKPLITYDANAIPQITEEHVTYLINYLGGTELKKVPLTENYPQIELLTSMKNTYFTSYVVDGEIQTYPGKATDPDLQIRIGEDTLAEIIKSQDPQQTTKDAKNNDKIGITIHAGKTELFLKGYLKIYDNLK